MSNQKNDSFFIKKMIDDIDYIASILKDVEIDVFSSNQMMSDSTVFRLIQISENIRQISDGLKSTVDYDWFKVSGMRNRLVHDYGNVDFGIVFNTAKNNLPELRDVLNRMIQLTK